MRGEKLRVWFAPEDMQGCKNLAVELREYHIPDFSNWKTHDTFEFAFADLLRDLRAQVS